ncbi:MAG: metal-dependent transcriptional regulator [Candidatus Thermoplasmatota archaeon]
MLSRKVEDYLEAILNVVEEKGYAKTRDVARVLNITSPSVVEMLKKLHKMDLIVYRKYDGATLTPRGKEIAASVKERHNVIKEFLELIRVSKEVAERDACLLEHSLDPKTIRQLKDLVNLIKKHT